MDSTAPRKTGVVPKFAFTKNPAQAELERGTLKSD